MFDHRKKYKPKKKQLDPSMMECDLDRLIEMAWQDRVSFDTIYMQYGITENQLKNKMRKLISKNGFKRWRKRVQNRTTKHKQKTPVKITRFQGPW